MNFLMFKLVLEKAEEPEIKLPTFTVSSKKQESSRKASISAFLTMPKRYQGNISLKDGLNKGQKWYRLKRSRDIKKRWQEYTELYRKDLHDPDNHDGMITDLEPDMLECEVKWALESITTNKAK